MPFAFLCFSVITGGDLLGDIVGIISGHVYYYLKDIVPLTFGKDFLITPNFVRKYLDAPNIYRPTAVHNYVNQNNTANATNNNNSNTNGNRGFVAFSGRGNTVG